MKGYAGAIRRASVLVGVLCLASVVTAQEQAAAVDTMSAEQKAALEADKQEIQNVIARWHQAYRDLDVQAGVRCLGETYLVVNRLAGPWGAEGVSYATRDEWAQGATKAIAESPGVKYEVTIEFLRADVSKSSGLVETKESGRWVGPDGQTMGDPWNGITNTWFLAKRDGEWKVVGAALGS